MPPKGLYRSPGRPRSESAGPAILKATRKLVVRYGYAAVTTQMIAVAARTGKQTIYRRWSSKAELVLAAFVEHAEQSIDRTSRRRRVDGRKIAEFPNRLFRALDDTGAAIRSLMAYAQTDEEFRRLLYQRLIEPRRQALRRVLEEAASEGEIAADIDFDVAITAIYGATWYRLLLDEPLDAAFAARLADLMTNGIRDLWNRPGEQTKRLSRKK
jgi:AcrR family transcriptional regulator